MFMGLYKKIDMNTDPLPLSPSRKGRGSPVFSAMSAQSDRVSFPLYGGRAGWGLLHIRFKPHMPPPPGDMF
jgi:hypothetical protein